MLIKKIKNNTGSPVIYLGQEIAPAAYYEIQSDEEILWMQDATLEADIASGDAVVNNDISDLSAADGIIWLRAVGPSCVETLFVDLAVNSTPPHLEGRIAYDSTEKALIAYNDEAAVTQQLGQENYIRVYNNSGAAITNGKPVYISGTEGVENRPTIALAKADAAGTATVIGVTTHTINNNSFGYVTTFGLVNDLDTSSFISGDKLFLDEVTAGSFKSTLPSDGNQICFIGYVVRSHATLGRILVSAAGTQSRSAAAGGASGALRYSSNGGSPDAYNLDADVWVKVNSYDEKKETGANYVQGDIVTNFRLTVGNLGGGKYLGTFQASIQATGGGTVSVGMAKNGAVVNSSVAEISTTNNNRFSLAGSDEFDLVAGDYIELHMRADTDTIDPMLLASSLTLNRIAGGQRGETGPQGIQGPQGSQGPAGLIGTWTGPYNAGTAYSVNDQMEYGGSSYNCIVATSAGENPDSHPSKWNLVASKGDVGTQIYGSEYQYAESLANSATTSATPVQKLRLTTPNLPLGDYEIKWYFEQSTDKTSIAVNAQVQINDTTTLLNLSRQYTSSLIYYESSGFAKTTLSGVNDIDLDHWTDAGSGAGSQIKNARLVIKRIS